MVATASTKKSLIRSPDESSDFKTDIILVGPRKAPETGNTLRDAAGALINRPQTTGNRPAREKESIGFGSGLGFALIDSVLESQLDNAFIDAATDIITPTIDPHGVVSLNLLGLRDFAFMVSPISNKIQVLDFKTGTTLTISQSSHKEAPIERNPNKRMKGPPSESNEKFVKFIQHLKHFAQDFVLQPLTLGALLLIAVCAGVMGIGRRTA